jgi:diphthamide synthase (EF-2-diphthine--ammonia ligase)
MLLWGGGKESALSYKKLKDENYNVTKLVVLTDEGRGVYNEKLLGVRTQRNYIPIEIIQEQANLLGVELIQIKINDIDKLSQYYESLNEWSKKCRDVYVKFKSEGGTHVAFGYFDSMCLESKNVGLAGLEPIYPLLQMTENEVIGELLKDNYACKIVRTSPSVTGIPAYEELCGKDWNINTIEKCKELGISPIGEDGSFGTICYDGPIFDNPIPIKINNILSFNVDDMLSTAKLSDMNAFNILQIGSKRTFANISL